MPNRDWSLVFFTTLAQWSVGIIAWFTISGVFYDDTGLIFENGLSLKNPALLSLILIGIATASSFLHLGKPLNAANTLNNLSSSWLSREILAIGVFSLCLLFVFVLGWTTTDAELLKVFLVLSSAAGIALLWSMIRIYVIATIPAWNSWFTPISFVSTAICLGLITFLVFYRTGGTDIDEPLQKTLLLALMLVLLIETSAGFFNQLRLEKLDTGIDRLVFDQGSYYQVYLCRMVLLIIVLLTIFVLLLEPGLLPGDANHIIFYALFILIIGQELLGRLLFYSSYFRLGI